MKKITRAVTIQLKMLQLPSTMQFIEYAYKKVVGTNKKIPTRRTTTLPKNPEADGIAMMAMIIIMKAIAMNTREVRA